MALLPKVPRRGEVLQGPQSRVGPGTIQTPYSVVAGLLADAGQQLTDWATARASTEGQNAVTRDENGNLQVRRMSDLTQVGRAYNRAAQQAYLARLSGDIETSAQQLAIEANGNVDAFRSSWEGYTQRTLDGVDPALRGAVTTLLEEVGGQTYRGISVDRYNSDVQKSLDALVAERARLADQILVLASQGGAGTADYESLVARYVDLGDELGNNWAYNRSAETERLTTDRVLAEARGEAIRYDVMQRFPLDPAAGMAYAREEIAKLTDMTPDDQRSLLADIQRGYTATSAAYQVQLDALGDRVDTMVDLLTKNLPYSQEELTQLINDAESLNAPSEAVRLDIAIMHRAVMDQLAAGGDEADLALWQTLANGGNIPMDVLQPFFAERYPGLNFDGLDAAFGTRLYTAIQAAEAATGQRVTLVSGVRSDIEQAQIYANSTVREGYPYPVVYQGVTYFADPNNPVGLAAAPGTSRHQSGQAADIAAGPALDWLHEHAAEFGLSFLSGDAFTADPGHIQLAGDGAAAPSAGITPELLADVRSTLGDDLRLLLDRTDTIYDTTHRVITQDDANLMVGLARAVDDPALTQRVLQAIYRSQGAATVDSVTPAQAEAYAAVLQSTGGGDAVTAAWIAQGVTARQEYLGQLREDNPALEGQVRGLYTLSPIDFSTAEAMGQGLALRQDQLAALQVNQGIPQQPLLQPDEAAQLGAALRAAPLDQAIAVIDQMASVLSPEALTATLGQIVDSAPEIAVAADYYARTGSDEVLRRLLSEQQLARDPSYRAPNVPSSAGTLATQLFGDAFSDLPAHQQRVQSIAWTLFLSMARERGIPADLGNSNAVQLYNRALQMAAGATYQGGVQYGGVTTVNGIVIVVPPGMRARDVEPLVRSITDRDLRALGGAPLSGNGVPVDAADLHNARLVAVGPGVYRVSRGTDEEGQPLFFAAQDGGYWLLDLNALQRRRTTTAQDVIDAAHAAIPDAVAPVAAWIVEQLNAGPSGATGPSGLPAEAPPASAPAAAPPGGTDAVTTHGLQGVPPPPAFEALTFEWVQQYAAATGQQPADAARDLAAFYGKTLDELTAQIRPQM